MDDSDATAERKWPHFGAFLAEAREKAGGGSPVKVSIRDLIWKIEAERRGTRVTDELQRALDRHGLITEPSFTSGWIDNVVELRLATSDSASTSDEKPPSDDGSSSSQVADLATVQNPDDIARTIKSVNDLTLGETVRFIEREANWQRLCWPVERAEFIKALREVTEIRNDVMHFSPDPMTAIEEAKLHNFVSWLRVMEPRARSIKT